MRRDELESKQIGERASKVKDYRLSMSRQGDPQMTSLGDEKSSIASKFRYGAIQKGSSVTNPQFISSMGDSLYQNSNTSNMHSPRVDLPSILESGRRSQERPARDKIIVSTTSDRVYNAFGPTSEKIEIINEDRAFLRRQLDSRQFWIEIT